HLGEAEFNATRVQRVAELANDICSCDVNAGDWLCRHNDPLDWCRRLHNGLQNPLLKELGIREEERRIPTEQDETWDQPGIRIPRDVVIGADPINTAEDSRMRPPAVPEKFDHGDENGEADSGDRTQHGHTCKTGHRKPELPALYAIDTAEVSEFEQAD